MKHIVLKQIFNVQVPYARHHNLLLIINGSWILTVHKDRFSPKTLLENKEMDFKNGVKNIQATVVYIVLQTMGWKNSEVAVLFLCVLQLQIYEKL